MHSSLNLFAPSLSISYILVLRHLLILFYFHDVDFLFFLSFFFFFFFLGGGVKPVWVCVRDPFLETGGHLDNTVCFWTDRLGKGRRLID